MTARATVAPTVTAASGVPDAVGGPTKVLVIVEENHTQGSALRAMPFLTGLSTTYGRTTAYRAVTHPSLPNYLAIAGGSTFGVTDDDDPSAHPIASPSVFDAAIAAGKTAKSYAESMPSACARTSSGNYAVKHNPWVYFNGAASRANCVRYDVPSGTTAKGALRNDIAAGRLPTVGMLIPNLCHDAHDCSLGTADAWLHTWMTAILAGPDYRSGRLAVVITFDEDDSSGPNTVLTVVVAPHTLGVSSGQPFTHYSLSQYMCAIAGTRPLRNARTALPLRQPFRLS